VPDKKSTAPLPPFLPVPNLPILPDSANLLAFLSDFSWEATKFSDASFALFTSAVAPDKPFLARREAFLADLPNPSKLGIIDFTIGAAKIDKAPVRASVF